MLFSILGNSGTVVPATLHNLYEKSLTCSILASTPSILATLPLPTEAFNPYRFVHTVLLGGETPPQHLLQPWLDHKVKILNAYGPTETTCASVMQIVEYNDKSRCIRSSVIGASMPQCPAFIISQDLELISDEEVDGEIVITGVSLAKGYLNDPALTADRFLDWRDTRMYRTGDQGRWVRNNDGNLAIEFRGRTDRVVKNRGFLLNLEADVEDAIRKLDDSIKAVHATLYRGRLIVLLTPPTADIAALRQRMKQTLSAFQIPDRVEAWEDFPLSANGKTDAHAIHSMLLELNENNNAQSTVSNEVAQDKTLQEVVACCMADVLGLSSSVQLLGDSNFFSLGGNSLAAMSLSSLCRQQGVIVTTHDIYAHQTLEKLSGLAMLVTDGNDSTIHVQQASDATIELRSQVREELGLSDEEFECGPLTPLQLHLILPTLACDGKNTNQMRISYDLKHVAQICKAWRYICEREAVFRTEMRLDIGTGVQIVRTSAKPTLPSEHIFSRRDDYENSIREASLEVGIGSRVDFLIFDPGNGEFGEMTIVWTVHHALLDGYSLALIMEKIEQAAKGSFATPNPSFMDAAIGLVRIQTERDTEARQFWHDYLQDIRPCPRSDLYQMEISSKAQELRVCLADHKDALIKAAAKNAVTLATLYYTAWGTAIASRTGTRSPVVGSVFIDRETQPSQVTAIGPMISTLPLKVHLDPHLTIKDQLKRTMNEFARIREYVWSSPEQIGLPLDNLLAIQDCYPEYENVVPFRRIGFFENTDFPLSLLVEKNATIRLVYDESVNDRAEMEQILDRFVTTLLGFLDAKISSDKVTGANDPLLLEGITIKTAFESSADLYWDLTALEDPDSALSYRELERLANIVAHSLLSHGGTARCIAIHADGSMNWIVGILAILKASCTYCPLDPAYTTERRASVYERSGSSLLLLPNHEQSEHIFSSDIPTVVVQDVLDKAETSEAVSSRPRGTAEPASDALIVFTSGTTGVPKGVPISHRGLLALQSNKEARMFASPGTRIAQFMSPAFDYCANEIFSALLHGATLVLRDSNNLYDHLRRVDVATITPSVLNALSPEDYPDLKMVSGGLYSLCIGYAYSLKMIGICDW